MVNQYKLITQIEHIADRASVDSGTSYERYIQLFSIYFDQVFLHTRDFNVATKLARVYGYVPKYQRVGVDWEEENCSLQGLSGVKHKVRHWAQQATR